MGLGLMNKKAKICILARNIDSMGFSFETEAVLAEVKVFVEGRHGSERWANFAAFSEATELYRIRKIPGLTITTEMIVIEGNERFEISSVEDVKGRGMYIELLCKEVKPSG